MTLVYIGVSFSHMFGQKSLKGILPSASTLLMMAKLALFFVSVSASMYYDFTQVR